MVCFHLQENFPSMDAVYITLAMHLIRMNKQSRSSDRHCRNLMKITWFPVLDLEMVAILFISWPFLALYYNLSNHNSTGCVFSATTHDQDVFCFYPDLRPCNGFSEALSRYRELVPHLRLAGKLMLPSDASYAGSILLIHTWNVVFWTGPTSFAPIIEMAMTIVEQSGGQYHVLLIIADGQVLCKTHKGKYFFC